MPQLTLAPDQVLREPRTRSSRGVALHATLLGILGFVVSAAWSWQPSYWGDEAASVMSAERSLPSLFRMLGNVDAVHGTYYLILHFWIDAFGASEFSTRLPSAIAIGAATAGTFVLARRLSGGRVALIAALVFAVLPRVTYMGAEARSTALATAITVWLTVLLVHLMSSRQPHGRARLAGWIGYSALLAFGIYVFLYLVLLLPMLALVVLLFGPRGIVRRQVLARWALSSAIALLLSAPVIVASLDQRQQIAFIGRRPQIGVLTAAVDQWFGNAPTAILAWSLIGVAVIATYLAWGRWRATPRARRTLAVMLAWTIVPSAVLLLGTNYVTPMYALRYLSICTPAAAIAIAIGIACVRWRPAQFLAVALIVLFAFPSYHAQRGEFGKNGGSDWRQAATVVQAGARPGDAIVFDESVRPSRKPRLASHLYPTAFRNVRDITLSRPFDATNWLWDETVDLPAVSDRLTNTPTVWLMLYSGSHEQKSGDDVRTLQSLGYTVSGSTTVNRTIIIEMTR